MLKRVFLYPNKFKIIFMINRLCMNKRIKEDKLNKIRECYKNNKIINIGSFLSNYLTIIIKIVLKNHIQGIISENQIETNSSILNIKNNRND